MKKILYGVSGIGNGHANRELPIITLLSKSNKIVILCYDDSYKTFERELAENKNIKLVRIAVPFVVGSSDGLNFGASAIHPFNQSINFTEINFKALDIVFSEIGKPDLAITDYEPVTAQYAYSFNIPLVTIDQQSKFLHSDLPETLGGFTFADEVHRLHMFFPKAASRIVCSFFKTQKRIGGEEVVFFPSPIKPAVKHLFRSQNNTNRILVYLSSARDFPQEPDEIIENLGKIKNASFDLFVKIEDHHLYSIKTSNIKLHPHGTDDFLKALSECDGVISTAGHSLLSECMYLGIPVYAIPVEPYEQHLNAYSISQHGFGISDLRIASKKTQEFIDNLDEYYQNIKTDREVLLRDDGGEQIFDYITKNFLSTKKIILFTPPFSGHLNVLKELIKDTKTDFEYHLVITGWHNIAPDLSGLEDVNITVLSEEELHETDPALWTFRRASLLMDSVLKIVDSFSPDLIIYDFFSIEGYLAGKLRKIPYFSSIPAFLGAFQNQSYLKEKFDQDINKKSLSLIENKYHIRISESDLEMVSDGFHLPGLVNLVWSFRDITPTNFAENRSSRPIAFIGNLRGDNYEKKNYLAKKPLIYLSFGTVVMNNLWNQQEDTRVQLVDFVRGLADLWSDKNYQVIFITQGKQILNEYPQNWWVYDHVEQVEVLSRADVFITHGGSNSFHESIMQRVPMVVIPFFGDQLQVASRVEDLGIGITAGGSNSIDTHTSKNFLNSHLIKQVDYSVTKILESSSFAEKIASLKLDYTSVKSLLKDEIPLNEGDTVWGDLYSVSEKRGGLPNRISTYLELLKTDSSMVTSQKLENILFVLKQLTENLIDDEQKVRRLLRFFGTFYQIHHVGFSDSSVSNYEKVLDTCHNIIYYQRENGCWLPVEKKPSQYKNVADLSKISRVVLASENKQKIDSLRDTLNGLVDNFELIAEDPKISVNEQLVGMDEIVSAAMQRLKGISHHLDEHTLLVSMVSGIIESNDVYSDVAVIFIQEPNGTIRYDKSLSIPLPSSSVKKAKARGFSSYTVGSVIAEEVSEKSIGTDPHFYITHGKISRTSLLSQALEKALRD